MSIVDALQRAKKLGKERLRESDATGTGAVSATRRRSEPARKIQAESQVQALTMVAPAFERLTYDVNVCARNHIIVPDVEPSLMQSASPPYRMLRTRILQRCRTSGWSTLSITSPGPGEGKSVTTLNLAISIAREGNHDVFLIDLDMRNPSMSRYLGVSPRREIASFFNGATKAEDVFFTVGIERLTLAGGLSATTQASELLATGRLEELLAYIRSIAPNPMILIDLPPVVSTDDALVVAPQVDATALIVSEGHTRRDGLLQALSLLSEFNVAGIILNQSWESVGSEYYGGAYS